MKKLDYSQACWYNYNKEDYFSCINYMVSFTKSLVYFDGKVFRVRPSESAGFFINLYPSLLAYCEELTNGFDVSSSRNLSEPELSTIDFVLGFEGFVFRQSSKNLLKEYVGNAFNLSLLDILNRSFLSCMQIKPEK